jgi:hypothetical protein
MHRRSSRDAIDARCVELARALLLAVEVDDVIAVTVEAERTLTGADAAALFTSTPTARCTARESSGWKGGPSRRRASAGAPRRRPTRELPCAAVSISSRSR